MNVPNSWCLFNIWYVEDQRVLFRSSGRRLVILRNAQLRFKGRKFYDDGMTFLQNGFVRVEKHIDCNVQMVSSTPNHRAF